MRTIELVPDALDDLGWMIANNRKLATKALKLMAECTRTPFEGTGKPEPLRGNLTGHWSRRISDEHRLIYSVTDAVVRVVACRGHYE